ncbi:MAG: TolC family protein [Bacteroidota bacterium]
MLKILSTIGLLLLSWSMLAQELTQLSLNEAYRLLEVRYPLLQNATILDQIHVARLQQLDIAKKPTLDWKADGRVQSESTQLESSGDMPLPIEINQPLVNIRTFVDANYTLLDGGINEAQRSLQRAQLVAEKQNLEVEKFALRERINSLFVNTLVLREQFKLFEFSLQDLSERKTQLRAGIEMGTVLPAALTQIEVKELELKSQQENLRFRIKGLIQSLGQLIGKELSMAVELRLPTLPDWQRIPDIDRPEEALFQSQREAILAQSDLIDAQRKPKVSAYAQAGIGYPNPLNILDNNLAPFGIVGARFSMPITDWNKSKIDRELLSLQAQKLNNAEATLAFNLDTKKANYFAEVRRLQSSIKRQEEIARLQKEIISQLAVQLDEGIITSTEYLTQVTAELKIRQNLAVYRTELIKVQLEFLNERNQTALSE